ncbi:MAG: hypothetical protein ACRELC_01440, partial [Gemmatimonadota bacterium]
LGLYEQPFRLPLASLLDAGWGAALVYLLGCVLTAILITFGAPFWHDLVGTLSAVSSRRREPGEPPPPRREEAP